MRNAINQLENQLTKRKPVQLCILPNQPPTLLILRKLFLSQNQNTFSRRDLIMSELFCNLFSLFTCTYSFGKIIPIVSRNKVNSQWLWDEHILKRVSWRHLKGNSCWNRAQAKCFTNSLRIATCYYNSENLTPTLQFPDWLENATCWFSNVKRHHLLNPDLFQNWNNPGKISSSRP